MLALIICIDVLRLNGALPNSTFRYQPVFSSEVVDIQNRALCEIGLGEVKRL